MKLRYLLQLVDLPGHVIGDINGKPKPGQFLAHFDPEAMDGMGVAEFTDDRDQAMHFSATATAFEFWRTQSRTCPLRPDGKPNRPLTAFSMTVVKDDRITPRS